MAYIFLFHEFAPHTCSSGSHSDELCQAWLQGTGKHMHSCYHHSVNWSQMDVVHVTLGVRLLVLSTSKQPIRDIYSTLCAIKVKQTSTLGYANVKLKDISSFYHVWFVLHLSPRIFLEYEPALRIRKGELNEVIVSFICPRTTANFIITKKKNFNCNF